MATGNKKTNDDDDGEPSEQYPRKENKRNSNKRRCSDGEISETKRATLHVEGDGLESYPDDEEFEPGPSEQYPKQKNKRSIPTEKKSAKRRRWKEEISDGDGLESQPDVEELPSAVPHDSFKPPNLQPDQTGFRYTDATHHSDCSGGAASEDLLKHSFKPKAIFDQLSSNE